MDIPKPSPLLFKKIPQGTPVIDEAGDVRVQDSISQESLKAIITFRKESENADKASNR